jgi:hypothetical protein
MPGAIHSPGGVRETGIGTLATRPAANAVPSGFVYVSTGDGTAYVSDGSQWSLLSSGYELASVHYSVGDDVARSPASGIGGFSALFGPTDTTPTTPANVPCQISWVSPGRPMRVRAKAQLLQNGTANPYIWATIDTLGGSTVGVDKFDWFGALPANGWTTAQPEALFNDAAGVTRTVGVAVALSAGTIQAKKAAGGQGVLLVVVVA